LRKEYIPNAENQEICYSEIMETTFLTERGTLTLPAAIRKSLGLAGRQQFIVEATPEGEIVLRPAFLAPIEVYSEGRIAEFERDDAALGAVLRRRGLKA
jgi:AbrB family looped-hinge helix DNA binding protein